jgi:hypothetical protein
MALESIKNNVFQEQVTKHSHQRIVDGLSVLREGGRSLHFALPLILGLNNRLILLAYYELNNLKLSYHPRLDSHITSQRITSNRLLNLPLFRIHD